MTDHRSIENIQERWLLSALLIGERDGIVAADHLAGLEATDFAGEREQIIFRAAAELRDAGADVNSVSVVTELERAGRLYPAWRSPMDCANELMAIIETDPPVWHVRDWSRGIQAASRKRRIAMITSQLSRDLHSISIDPDRIAQAAEEIATLARAGASPQKQTRVTTLEAAAKSYLQEHSISGGKLVETGIPDLDHAIGGGVEFGEMVLLCARPSHGKSMVGLQMVHNWTSQGIACAFISEEMSALSLGKRAIQFASGIHQEHWANRSEALKQDMAVHFDNRATCIIAEQCRTVAAACHSIRQAVKKHGVRCVVVDYAQLLNSPGGTRYEQVTATSIALRQVANETGVLLVALCQLNRQLETRSPMIPHPSDIKDSGQLEQDADVIVFLVWPHRIDSENDPHLFQFFIGKNRNRAINVAAIECRFEPGRQRVVTKRAEPAMEPSFDQGWR